VRVCAATPMRRDEGAFAELPAALCQKNERRAAGSGKAARSAAIVCVLAPAMFEVPMGDALLLCRRRAAVIPVMLAVEAMSRMIQANGRNCDACAVVARHRGNARECPALHHVHLFDFC
jgi:hypothetical protein